MSAPHPEPELLLAHADFVRALARTLVGAAGDDLAQEAYAKVLRQPPPAPPGRAWWAKVLRRLASNLRRQERRRQRREAVPPLPEPAPTPAQVLLREEVRARVVQAVLRLEPPFQQVVLLRYYDDLDATQIAARLQIPAATVRTRLKRGLERLRLELDREHGGDRAAWATPLLPWAAVPGAAAGLLTATIVMKKTLMLAAAAAALCLLAAWFGPWWSEPAVLPDANANLAAAALPNGASATPTAAPDPGVAAPRTAVAAAPTSAPQRFPAERGLGALHGTVLDGNGQPAGGAIVVLQPWRGHLPAGFRIDDDRAYSREAAADAMGAFRFDEVPEGPCRVSATAADGRGDAEVTAVAAARRETVVLQLGDAEPRRDEVVVSVADAEQVPQVGAQVDAFVTCQRDLAASRAEVPTLQQTTDEHGRARFRGQGLVGGVFFVRTGDGRVGLGLLSTDDQTRVQVTVAAPGGVRGRLVGAAADQLVGATVQLHALQFTHAYHSAAGRSLAVPVQGTEFACAELPAGEYGLTLHSPSGLRLQLEPMQSIPNSVAMRTVTVAAGAVTEVALPVLPGGSLLGTVALPGGAPVAGARVRAVLAPATSNFPAGFVLHGVHVWRLDSVYEAMPRNPQSHFDTVSDALGCYTLRGLPPGEYRVEVVADRLSLDRRHGIVVADRAEVELRHVLHAAGVLQVATRDHSYLGVAPPGHADQPVALAIVANGMGTFPGLAAGRYSVVAYHSDPRRVAPRPIGDVTVVADRTTWADLRGACVQTTIAGRVFASGQPVAGAVVQWYPWSVLTDAQGAFTLELGYRVTGQWQAPMDRRFVVAVHGVRHAMVPEDMSSGAALFEPVLQLGTHELPLQARTTQGAAGPVVFVIRGEANTFAPATSQGIEATLQSATGELRVPHLPAGTYYVTARFPSGATSAAQCTVPASGPVRLDEPEHGAMTVRVVDRHGAPASRHRVTLFVRRGPAAPPADDAAFCQGAEVLQADVDESGVAKFAAVPAGHVLVQANTRGFGSGSPQSSRCELLVGAVLELRVTMP